MTNLELYMTVLASNLNILASISSLYFTIRVIIQYIQIKKLNKTSYTHVKIWIIYYATLMWVNLLSGLFYMVSPTVKLNPILDITFTISHFMPLFLIHIIFNYIVKRIIDKNKNKKHNYEF